MWKNEAALVHDFIDTISATKRTHHIVTEFRTGYGLPDILVIEYDKHLVRRRLRTAKSRHLTPFDINCAYTMAYLSERRWVKIAGLTSMAFVRNGSVNSVIRNLADRRLVTVKGDNVKCRRLKDIFAIKCTVAIEAKLKKWKKAVDQAQRYLWFTNNSNILIPDADNTRIEAVSTYCRENRVGLITLGKGNTVSVVSRREKLRPYNTYLAWLLNEIVYEEVRSGREDVRSRH